MATVLGGPTLPFYVTLAPGDTLIQHGNSIESDHYAGELKMDDGDTVITGSESQGASLLHTGDGHVFTLLPNTKISAHAKDREDAPDSKSRDSEKDYLFLYKGGLLGSSGLHGGRHGNELLLAGEAYAVDAGGKVIVKTTGSTTGVMGSTFVLRLVGDSTVISLFDCQSAHFVNKDGNTYDNDGSVAEEITIPSKGPITHR